MASVLTLLQAASRELKQYSEFTTVIGNSDAHVQLLLALANEEVKETRLKKEWPALNREAIFTLVADQENYELPGDFRTFVDGTGWDRTGNRPLYGPLTPQQWQSQKSGIVQYSVQFQYRIKGIKNRRLYIFPVPTTSDAGKLLYLEYISKSCVRPKTWVSGEDYLANQCTFYDGNIYCCTVGGTTGATPPTHTTGTASDGGVTWEYSTDVHEDFEADTDEPIIDDNIFKLGVKWRWKAENGFDYTKELAQWNENIRMKYIDEKGAQELCIASRGGSHLLGYDNMPETLEG